MVLSQVYPLAYDWEINDEVYGVNYTVEGVRDNSSIEVYDTDNTYLGNKDSLARGGQFIVKYTHVDPDQECALEYWINVCLNEYGFDIDGNAHSKINGQEYEGGYIFYYENDYDNESVKLLIVDLEDLSSLRSMNTNSNYDASETSEEYFQGYANTEYLVDHGATTNTAQNRCWNHSTNGGQINDWYLPSKYELNLLWDRMTLATSSGPSLKNISDDDFVFMEKGDWYWSSSLYSDDEAWQYANFVHQSWDEEYYDEENEAQDNPRIRKESIDNVSGKVRCIRMVEIPMVNNCD